MNVVVPALGRIVGALSLPPFAQTEYDELMNRADALIGLKAQADAVRAMGATSLYLFGSTVRNQAGAGSDLDLFIEYDACRKFSPFDLVGIKLFLEERLGAEVDVTTRDSLHPQLRDGIERSSVRVF